MERHFVFFGWWWIFGKTIIYSSWIVEWGEPETVGLSQGLGYPTYGSWGGNQNVWITYTCCMDMGHSLVYTMATGAGFKYFSIFVAIFWDILIQFDSATSFRWVKNHQLDGYVLGPAYTPAI